MHPGPGRVQPKRDPQLCRRLLPNFNHRECSLSASQTLLWLPVLAPSPAPRRLSPGDSDLYLSSCPNPSPFLPIRREKIQPVLELKMIWVVSEPSTSPQIHKSDLFLLSGIYLIFAKCRFYSKLSCNYFVDILREVFSLSPPPHPICKIGTFKSRGEGI